MHITLTQDEISVAVYDYMKANFPSLDVSTADIEINEDGEAEISVNSQATPTTPKKATTTKRSTRKKVQAKKAEEPAENVVALKDEVAQDDAPFDADPVETKEEVAKEEAPINNTANSKSLFA